MFPTQISEYSQIHRPDLFKPTEFLTLVMIWDCHFSIVMGTSYSLPALIVFAIKIVSISADPLRSGADQIEDFCHRFDHRTAVLGNKMFVDGGFVNLLGHRTNYTSKIWILCHD
jgi:hypothetical protein